ncbi:MAG: choice-of-anchor J domain-containing protein, partial [Clostridia bacterium]|nr:choice-of-anchor J domain-containing protein [Clostridia bacterium]
MKKTLSILLAVVFCLTLFPLTAAADDPEPENKEKVLYSCGFESETDFDDWTLIDSDGDGHNWYFISGSGIKTHEESTGVLTSASYYYAPLTPDNWAISPAVEIPTDGAMLSLWTIAQDASYPYEHYSIYVGESTDISNMESISGKDPLVTTA